MYTKHLESRNKLDQLLALFGCEFREGRPDKAPALRRDPGAEADLPTFAVGNQLPHDTGVLPHLHLREDIETMFPAAVPHSPRRGDDEDAQDGDLEDPVPAMDRRRASFARSLGTVHASRVITKQKEEERDPGNRRPSGRVRNSPRVSRQPGVVSTGGRGTLGKSELSTLNLVVIEDRNDDVDDCGSQG